MALREGVAKDRIVSVHDPEMRHGRKSSQQRFDGHKTALAVEAESQLITAVAVLPGNAPDALGTLALVAESERRLEGPVAETVADVAYGDGDTSRQFAEADRTLIAKVPKPSRSARFTKQDFQSTWRPAAARPAGGSQPISTTRAATATDTENGSRDRPLCLRARSVTAVACDRSV